MKDRMFLSVILLLFLSITLLINPVFAWTSYTHQWICDSAGLSGLDCAAADKPSVQSKYHDLAPVHHHCADNATDCAARVYAEKFFAQGTNESSGFAAHLYADSMTPVHWYSTDYNTCHKIFEDKVEEKLRNSEDKNYRLFGKDYDFSVWNISMDCTAKFGKVNKSVELYADNVYMDNVVKYVAYKMGVKSVPESKSVKEFDLTPILIALIILIVIIFILFFYIGLRNKKK